MRILRLIPCLLALSILPAWAAERVVVNPAQLSGPFGTDYGKIIVVGGQMIFVDDVNPANSFVIPRSEIAGFNLQSGVMTVNLKQPFRTAPQGPTSTVTVRLLNPNSYDVISSWAGMPMRTTGTYGEAARSQNETATQAAVPPQTEYSFNMKSGDENGRLVIGANNIHWYSLSNPGHSHRWPYASIKSFTRDRNDTEVELTPYNGPSYRFRFTGGPSMTDEVYNMVGDRIVAATVR
jgi:hypothetical protein